MKGMARTIALVAAGLSALATAGNAGSTTFAGPGGVRTAEVGVVRDCASEEVHRLVHRFFAAFNVGNSRRLDTLFAADDRDGDAGTPSFLWYSTGKPGARFGRAADDRSTLIRYFAARHRAGERLYLLWLSRGGNANGYFDLAFHIVRRAHGLPPTAFEGKGAAICSGSSARIAVWSGRESNRRSASARGLVDVAWQSLVPRPGKPSRGASRRNPFARPERSPRYSGPMTPVPPARHLLRAKDPWCRRSSPQRTAPPRPARRVTTAARDSLTRLVTSPRPYAAIGWKLLQSTAKKLRGRAAQTLGASATPF